LEGQPMNRNACDSQPASVADGERDLGEQFRVIAEIGGDVAWSVDCALGLPRYISPSIETLLGYSVADFHDQFLRNDPGSPLAPLCAGLAARLQRFAAGDRTRLRVVREFDQPHKQGGIVPIEVLSTLVLDNTGSPTALVGLVRDLSGRRAHEAGQRRFTSMLNHEFRTPLSTIDGAIQRLEVTGARADEATRARYRKIANAVDRLAGLLDDYLSPERMEAIGRRREPNSIAPRTLLDEGAAQVRAAGRTVTVEASGLPPALRCEPEGLRLALKVLLDNAIQYSPAGTAVWLSGHGTAGGIDFVVRNDGGGVDADEAPRIFDKFFRGRNAAGLPGSGLGLYMARSVVEVHGGALSLEPAGDGGAAFRIWLPTRGGAGKNVASGGSSSDNRNNTPG
jgi:two-component system OmpR family sensor kinase